MILVTGGAGYIGSHFVKTYLERNPQHNIVVVDNLSEGHEDALLWRDRIHFYNQGIGDIETVSDIMRRHQVDAVVHFAASCYVGVSERQPTQYFHNNVIETLNLLAAMEHAGVYKIVFSSTCATYGEPQQPQLDETHPQHPINIYGLTKLIMEQAIEGYCRTVKWSAVALRYFNAAGADESGLIGERHDPETHLIPLVLQAALGRFPAIEVYGTDYDTPDGTCVRDYIHVTDLADAHCRALEFLGTHRGFTAINLGTSVGASVQTIIDTCREITGQPIPQHHSPRRPGDPAYLVARADKARDLLGWTPHYNLHQIIQTAWQWEQNKSSHTHN